ncbi:Formiminotransferase-cyclodeaminase [Desulfarculus baarsii DSM 2075]|uniref:Formiminotransferase-cyclodeaminase n=1 Tax=Desulfarculus baarsii (strain ATCC 33931 / DSM 2075 / LMG 7858 / VKM B-1802 / 2st14) TaxID=644282 RepID=E1QGK3_DESB2|nr:cyclodeaminase/cyclohydrolase family protein [Desulfarculus baarsii]ADK84696.1 Formiminotransferase-cyclodeaminase [Desulfarculus baarsii DSM 2075]
MVKNVYEMVFNDFIADAASSSHMPGGGNVSAAVGTLACSMVCMVGNLTVGKKAYAEFDAQAQEVVSACEAIIAKLKDLTLKDMEAFDQYMGVFKMPKETDAEKKARAEALQAAAKKATDVPMEICRTCLEIVKQADKLSHFGNKMAISDVGVGAMTAVAALKSCMLSVDINLPSIKDQDYVAQAKAERARLFVEAEELCTLAMARVKEKMG